MVQPPAKYDVTLIISAWLVYLSLHSLLADDGFKSWCWARWPGLQPYYRLIYNVLAVLLLALPLGASYSLATAPFITWSGAAAWLMNLLGAGALLGFICTLRYYDMRSFLGIARADSSNEPMLTISPVHRWIRHPWYFFGLVVLWTRDLSVGWFGAAVVISLYLVIGSRREEGRLVNEFPRAYPYYQARVPALLPWRGRALDFDAMQTLKKLAMGDANMTR